MSAASISCPCGCGLLTVEPGVRMCSRCETEQPRTHWDELYDMCDRCAWCVSLDHDSGPCEPHCYPPTEAARDRTRKWIAVFRRKAAP